MSRDSIAILDCGGQYTKIIDRRVRELKVRSEIFPINTPSERLAGFKALILSGGPSSVWADHRPDYDASLFDQGIPILGICYGMQLMNVHFGGRVRPEIREEYGQTPIRVDPASPLFHGLEPEQAVLMSHGDSVEILAPGFESVAESRSVTAAIADRTKRLYGVQFHPEVDLTVSGREILRNFLYGICGLTGDYLLEDRIGRSIEKIRKTVGRGKVLVLVSGGVDSVVTATLLLRALRREQVYAIHVDHGFMRKDESAEICSVLREIGLKQLVCVNVEHTFLSGTVEEGGRSFGPITAVADPEEKRRIIGNLFIRVVHDAFDELKLDPKATFIAQGTLRPDLIESGNPDVSDHAQRIKTHHNDVDVVRRARAEGRIIETNWDWHKDEVREVARRLGIPRTIAERQPFPGPGLAIRCLCHEGETEAPRKLRRLFQEYCREKGLTGAVLPLKSVGVQGDSRSYRYLSLLWGSGLDADWGELALTASRIAGRLQFINRVAYLLNGRQPPEGIITHRGRLNRGDLDLLREIDAVVRCALDRPPVSQVFAVLLPLGREGRKSVAIRGFVTSDYMTGRAAEIGRDIDRHVVADLTEELKGRFGALDLILYDVTGKPPATVEWE